MALAVVLVVLGGVTDQECDYLLTTMILNGLDPTVVRIRGYETEEKLLGYRNRDARMDLDDDAYTDFLSERVRRLILPLFKDGMSLDDVKAIILPKEARNERLSPWGWLMERLPSEIARYRVHECQNGYPNWLESLGEISYGSLPSAS